MSTTSVNYYHHDWIHTTWIRLFVIVLLLCHCTKFSPLLCTATAFSTSQEMMPLSKCQAQNLKEISFYFFGCCLFFSFCIYFFLIKKVNKTIFLFYRPILSTSPPPTPFWNYKQLQYFSFSFLPPNPSINSSLLSFKFCGIFIHWLLFLHKCVCIYIGIPKNNLRHLYSAPSLDVFGVNSLIHVNSRVFILHIQLTTTY